MMTGKRVKHRPNVGTASSSFLISNKNSKAKKKKRVFKILSNYENEYCSIMTAD